MGDVVVIEQVKSDAGKEPVVGNSTPETLADVNKDAVPGTSAQLTSGSSAPVPASVAETTVKPATENALQPDQSPSNTTQSETDALDTQKKIPIQNDVNAAEPPLPVTEVQDIPENIGLPIAVEIKEIQSATQPEVTEEDSILQEPVKKQTQLAVVVDVGEVQVEDVHKSQESVKEFESEDVKVTTDQLPLTEVVEDKVERTVESVQGSEDTGGVKKSAQLTDMNPAASAVNGDQKASDTIDGEISNESDVTISESESKENTTISSLQDHPADGKIVVEHGCQDGMDVKVPTSHEEPKLIPTSLHVAHVPTPQFQNASTSQKENAAPKPSQPSVHKVSPITSNPFRQQNSEPVKATSTPWAGQKLAVDQTGEGAPVKASLVQMVGSHEDSQADVQQSNEEYRKQFSERKKFFKQQMEQQNSLPIKIAPPPAVLRQQAPAPTAPLPSLTNVVLSPVQLPPQFKFPAGEAPQIPLNQSVAPPPPVSQPVVSAPIENVPQPETLRRFSITAEVTPAQTGELSSEISEQLQSNQSIKDAPTPFQSPVSITSTEQPLWSAPTLPQPPMENQSETLSFLTTGPRFDARSLSNSKPSLPGFAVAPNAHSQFSAQQPTLFGVAPKPAFMPEPASKSSIANTYNQFSAPQNTQQNYAAACQSSSDGGQVNGFTGQHAPLPDLTDLTDLPGVGPVSKKKTFVDSSFYADKNELYPTFEEQIDLCRQISSSLTSEDNKQSLGARMFTRRKNTSKKWTVQNGNQGGGGAHDQWKSDDEGAVSDNESSRPSGAPPLKYYMSPRGVDDAASLMQKDPEAKICDVISPVSIAAVAEGLHNTSGRGADLFNKRKLKSEEWIVDENNVKKPPPALFVDSTQQNKLQDLLNGPAVRYIKSPWEAALESPIGSCEHAFESVRPSPGGLAISQSLLSRTPSPLIGNSSPLPMIQPAVISPPSPAPKPTDPFLRSPKGWGADSSPKPVESSPVQPPTLAPKPVQQIYRPPTPESTIFLKPQLTPKCSPGFVQQTYTPQPQSPSQELVNTVYRAAPPVVTDYNQFSDVQMEVDVNIPNYQPAPQALNRRHSQQFENSAPQTIYQQQPPANQRPQSYYEISSQQNLYKQPHLQPVAARHVTWHPEVKQAQNWAPQSTDEFKRLYEERHKKWERPVEHAQARVHQRSKSQPPAPFQPNQQRGYVPSFNAGYQQQQHSAPRWGSDMHNWQPRPQSQQQPPQRYQSAASPNRTSWGPDTNTWQQQSFQQGQKPSGQLGGWGPDMHNWTPKVIANAPVYQQSKRPQKTGTWGGDMHNWKTPEIPGLNRNPGYQAGPRFPPSQTPQNNKYSHGNRQQHVSRYRENQQPNYNTLSRSWNGNQGGILVSDL